MMPVTRSEIVQAARAWLGTPFHHQACVKGRGADCAGLAKGIALELGIITPEQALAIPANYKAHPDPAVMRATLEAYMLPVWPAQLGDWLWLAATGKQPTHMAMVASDATMIHAHAESGAVVEHALRPAHTRTAKGAYSYRGVLDG
jgi:cell wall-associated NlpC family hydrolase